MSTNFSFEAGNIIFPSKEFKSHQNCYILCKPVRNYAGMEAIWNSQLQKRFQNCFCSVGYFMDNTFCKLFSSIYKITKKRATLVY